MILLLALLCAAPEKIVLVAKPHREPGVFHPLGQALNRAVHRLYEKDDPDVDDGNARAAQNDPEGALRAYDRALERLPDSPELHFDRAGQQLKMGGDHAETALKESLQALQAQDRSLQARASYHVALAQEGLGKPDDAMKAYRQALTLDPGDEDSKVNLELLLKSEEERKQQQQQPQESKEKNQQKDQQPDKSKGEQQQKDRQKQAGEKKEEKKEQAGEQQQEQPKEERKEQQAEEQKPVDRSEAERLLDALRAGEKNLQVWRFAKDKRKETRRGDVEKDW
jgi:tetratricopeptide (TPR) repeat protein